MPAVTEISIPYTSLIEIVPDIIGHRGTYQPPPPGRRSFVSYPLVEPGRGYPMDVR